MSGEGGVLRVLAVHFALLSFLSIGGANAVVPEMHRQAVEISRWMTDRQFADLFAIAQITPGPNVIIVTLIGFQVAGLAGALVATAAMCVPTCILAYAVGQTWERFKDAPWRAVIQSGLVPVSIGLIAASALILAKTADRNLVCVGLTVATAVVAYRTRLNPLWMFALAGLLGAAGLA